MDAGIVKSDREVQTKSWFFIDIHAKNCLLHDIN